MQVEIKIPLRRTGENEGGSAEEYFKVLHDEYTHRYLEQIGVEPTSTNKAFVARTMPMKDCEIKANWEGRGTSSVADSIKILPPRRHEFAEFEGVSDLDRARREQWYGKADPIAVAPPQAPPRTIFFKPGGDDEDQDAKDPMDHANLQRELDKLKEDMEKGGRDFRAKDLKQELERAKGGDPPARSAQGHEPGDERPRGRLAADREPTERSQASARGGLGAAGSMILAAGRSFPGRSSRAENQAGLAAISCTGLDADTQKQVENACRGRTMDRKLFKVMLSKPRRKQEMIDVAAEEMGKYVDRYLELHSAA